MKIYYYSSGHGYGHISRSSVILLELLKCPQIEEIHLVSDRISFIDWEHPKLKKRKVNLDLGVIQKDSLSIDLKATEANLQTFEKDKHKLIQSESKYCRENSIKLIMSDVSSLPMVIAVEAEIPSIFIGNFTWDFIYRHYANQSSYFSYIADLYATEYSFATEALFLPLTCSMPSFLETKNIGFVGRKPNVSKEEAKNSFGFRSDKTYILMSFGAYGLSGFPLNLEKLSDEIVLVASGVPGLVDNRIFVPREGHYPDLVSACDFVLTKPGYGIISECVYAKTPILYTERGDFAEYPVLTNWLDTFFPSSYISHEQISNCDFNGSISSIDNSLWTTKLKEILYDGEKTVVEQVLEYS
ncbi:glycosyltransferase family 1 [Leptospira ryugenii]|uniref:Glycosyltransferase family 1 n=1 Tax=Leptospira ryugenii TaxID=1917863 RepID=A0A2P2DYU3_9LEPT|nr:glycosyl transferase [Leptospira ryugenii]GBF49794.1 glycosyltransferase family 1 [Leptospira ryugenii]